MRSTVCWDLCRANKDDWLERGEEHRRNVKKSVCGRFRSDWRNSDFTVNKSMADDTTRTPVSYLCPRVGTNISIYTYILLLTCCVRDVRHPQPTRGLFACRGRAKLSIETADNYYIIVLLWINNITDRPLSFLPPPIHYAVHDVSFARLCRVTANAYDSIARPTTTTYGLHRTVSERDRKKPSEFFKTRNLRTDKYWDTQTTGFRVIRSHDLFFPSVPTLSVAR